ncbi:unnamed protein product [Tetraodon nigroviridis]|uniref:(spotted green pufferfish) hypothetical protein n=1 Tax=Tetraodon nigroviridis TaxID=99883 RepID=Q4RPJ4_TETNG|nr:unnamed protein product [Tetraodon nigroviridis]
MQILLLEGAASSSGPPQRRAQTSDLENYPGSTLGQSPQQQAGVRMVTRRFNQCLTASSAEQSVSVFRKNSV